MSSDFELKPLGKEDYTRFLGLVLFAGILLFGNWDEFSRSLSPASRLFIEIVVSSIAGFVSILVLVLATSMFMFYYWTEIRYFFDHGRGGA